MPVAVVRCLSVIYPSVNIVCTPRNAHPRQAPTVFRCNFDSWCSIVSYLAPFQHTIRRPSPLCLDPDPKSHHTCKFGLPVTIPPIETTINTALNPVKALHYLLQSTTHVPIFFREYLYPRHHHHKLFKQLIPRTFKSPISRVIYLPVLWIENFIGYIS